MDKLIVFLVLAAILGTILLIGFLSERNKVKRFRGRLKREFVKPLDRDYSNERMGAMRGYFESHKDNGFHIDDITWNDLGVDDFIQKYNHSYSSVGDEILYAKLRMPAQKEEDGNFERLEYFVKEFSENENLRVEFQVLMAKLGRSGRYSLYKYLEYLSDVKPDHPVLTIIDWIIYVGIIVFMFVNFYPALVMLVVWIIGNVCVYLVRKHDIEAYFTSFEYILRLLKTSVSVNKLLPDGFKPEKEILKNARGKLRGISTGNLVFLQSDTSSAVGDIGNGLMNFVKMFFQIDIFLFYRMKNQVEKNTEAIDSLFETLGMLDFAVNVASYRTILPQHCIPEFAGQPVVETEEMIHPLLLSEGVSNSVKADGGILLTGSNASGKSTFLRMIGLNALLAQSMHTVYAKSYKGAFYRIYSSMSLKDSLLKGESYYMAEIRSIKRILTAMEEDSSNVLCFVDEVLRGTNTKERIAAGAEIMRSMQNDHSICFAATHDIELAHLLLPQFTNYHFDDEIREDDIFFPYKLKEGYATSRNAIALLRIMGYPEDIVNNANAYVNREDDKAGQLKA